jgi:hypothetical protein
VNDRNLSNIKPRPTDSVLYANIHIDPDNSEADSVL